MIRYQVFNHLDEQQRFRGVTFYIKNKPEQVNSHGYSYMYCRKMLQELGQEMGLDIPKSDLEARLHEKEY
jgi:hypothetical protein